MEPFETTPLDPEQLGEATGVLLRSFHGAPQFVAVCPDPAKRLRLLRIFFGVALRDVLTHGHIDVASRHGRIAGVALWLPPGQVVMTPARQVRAALPMSRIGFFAPRALSCLARLGTALDVAHPREPHWLPERAGG